MCIRDSNDTVRGFMNKMLHEEIIPTLPLDKKDLEDFASAVEDRFNNPCLLYTSWTPSPVPP